MRQGNNAGYARLDNIMEVENNGVVSSRQVPLMTAGEIHYKVQQAGQGINRGMDRCVSLH